ncbi:hypothetical protein MTO96_007469 [Rhipicephalus appendiculatus]
MLFASRGGPGPAANQTAIDAAGSSLASRPSHGAAGRRWKPGVQRFRDDSLVSPTDGWPELRRHLASVFRRDAERSAAAQRAPSAHAPRGCNPCGAATAGIATHERRQARAPRPPPPRYVSVQTSRAAAGTPRHGRRCVYARHAVFRNHAVADPSYSSNGHRSPNYERPAPADLPRTNLASHSPPFTSRQGQGRTSIRGARAAPVKRAPPQKHASDGRGDFSRRSARSGASGRSRPSRSNRDDGALGLPPWPRRARGSRNTVLLPLKVRSFIL